MERYTTLLEALEDMHFWALATMIRVESDPTRRIDRVYDTIILAAKYHADQNILLANADFRVFADMVTFFVKEFDQVPGIEDLARDAVRGWFEQALVEAVMGVQGLMNSKEWSQTEIDAALSEEALTTAVMQRYHVHFAVKRELASKVGSRRAGAVG